MQGTEESGAKVPKGARRGDTSKKCGESLGSVGLQMRRNRSLGCYTVGDTFVSSDGRMSQCRRAFASEGNRLGVVLPLIRAVLSLRSSTLSRH
jgi:hypothetical protein